jgi:hypothetical protein
LLFFLFLFILFHFSSLIIHSFWLPTDCVLVPLFLSHTSRILSSARTLTRLGYSVFWKTDTSPQQEIVWIG